jgi:hypothetical protein
VDDAQRDAAGEDRRDHGPPSGRRHHRAARREDDDRCAIHQAQPGAPRRELLDHDAIANDAQQVARAQKTAVVDRIREQDERRPQHGRVQVGEPKRHPLGAPAKPPGRIGERGMQRERHRQRGQQ